MYTDDADVLPPGQDMVKGHSAIEALWKQEMGQIGDVKCSTLDVKPLGRRAAREVGTCTFKTKGEPPQEGAIKYVVVWNKSGRSWKLLTDIWNTSK
jgi:ketosteroid isomerase-like protein